MVTSFFKHRLRKNKDIYYLKLILFSCFYRNNDELCITFHIFILTIFLNQYVFNKYIIDNL